MEVGVHRQIVGAHLVGKIAIGSDAIRAHQHRIHLAIAHQDCGHTVALNLVWNTEPAHLPGGQASALQ